MDVSSVIAWALIFTGIVGVPVFFLITLIRSVRKSQTWSDSITSPRYPRDSAVGSGNFHGMDFGENGSTTMPTSSHGTQHHPSPCDATPHHGPAGHASSFSDSSGCAPAHSSSSFDSGSSYDSGGSSSGGFDSGGSSDGGGGGDGG